MQLDAIAHAALKMAEIIGKYRLLPRGIMTVKGQGAGHQQI
jgi:hypothetical protein